MSGTPRKGSPALSDAFNTFFSEIVEFQESISMSPTSFFLNPRKYHRPLNSPGLRQTQGRTVTKSMKKPVEIPMEETSLFLSTLSPASPTVPKTPLQPSFPPDSPRLSTLLPRETPRFPPISFREKLDTYQPSIRLLSPQEIDNVSLRIRTNIQKVRNWTPYSRSEAGKLQAEKEKMRLIQNKITRFNLYLGKKRKREEEMKDKIRRFEWRMNADFIEKSKKIWAGILLSLEIAQISDIKLTKMKNLHKKARKLQLFWLKISQFCGKILRSIKKNREKRAFLRLKRFLPYFLRFNSKIRLKKCELIAELFSNFLNRAKILNLVKNWESKVRV